jgi:RNA:NAD 2'-phosphotransferase (TPT1/KptA family)
MIYINLPAALSAGIAFFRSANGVILTEGGVGGHAMPVRARQ